MRISRGAGPVELQNQQRQLRAGRRAQRLVHGDHALVDQLGPRSGTPPRRGPLPTRVCSIHSLPRSMVNSMSHDLQCVSSRRMTFIQLVVRLGIQLAWDRRATGCCGMPATTSRPGRSRKIVAVRHRSSRSRVAGECDAGAAGFRRGSRIPWCRRSPRCPDPAGCARGAGESGPARVFQELNTALIDKVSELLQGMRRELVAGVLAHRVA